MDSLIARILDAWAATSGFEATAAALGLVYLVLVIRQNRWCWVAAFVSTLMYLWVFADARLYMQAALQGYYVAMAVYGWLAWRGREGRPALAVTRWDWRRHALGVAAVACATAASAAWLAVETDSAQPVLDAFTTWASVYTTWLVARKVLENWAWWLVIDALIAVLCWQQQLYATAALYALYLVLVVVGWRAWLVDWRRHAAGDGAAVPADAAPADVAVRLPPDRAEAP